MKWYICRIVFQIICGDGNHTAQFDEQLRLVQADDEYIAFDKASNLGRDEEDRFYNNKDQLVQWKFINVSDLYLLSLIDNAELFSKIQEVEKAQDYISLVHAKANRLKARDSHKLLHLL
ncbi:MAG TPA: DUF4288 domain-containing protein [Chitinophagaceae bacterium]|jgi:hypothetical protein|nr:DUF4288 domain-containing protein [Chitinophagaceae bacterium]